MRPILASVSPLHNCDDLEIIHEDNDIHQSTNNLLPIKLNQINIMTYNTSLHDYPTMNLHNTTNTTSFSNKTSHDNSLIDPAGSIVPTISVFVHSATKPLTSANIQDCFDGTNPLRSFWIQTAYEQYDKNASY